MKAIRKYYLIKDWIKTIVYQGISKLDRYYHKYGLTNMINKVLKLREIFTCQ